MIKSYRCKVIGTNSATSNKHCLSKTLIKPSKCHSMEEKCYQKFKDHKELSPEEQWLLPDTIEAINHYKVSIKGPLTT
ncbi:hypothetical protein DD744_08120, partial [Helicobacter pylori]